MKKKEFKIEWLLTVSHNPIAKVTHLPTGLVEYCGDYLTPELNIERARLNLRRRLS